METRTQYPSDVTDEQWRILGKLLPPRSRRAIAQDFRIPAEQVITPQ